MYPSYMSKPTFMTNTANTSFGASTSTFGQPAANTSMFSSMQPSNIFQTPNTSSFNAVPSTQSGFGTNLFGQQPQPSTSGLFGGNNAFGQNKATFGFGSTPAQTGLFGQQPQQQTGSALFQSPATNLFGSGAFGNQTTGTVIKFSPVTGTDTMQKNGVTQSISTKHHCITCMKEYESKSLEELRAEDYSCNRKGPQQQPGFGAAPFGASTSGTTTSLFGQTDNKQGFGQQQAFGQTSAFGQTTPAFGVSNQTNTSNLFGKPTTFGATTSTAPSFGFNAAPSTSNPFSTSQTQKPFSQPLFGTSTTQAQPTFGTGVFGQTNAQNTASNLFQKPNQPTTGFNTGQGFSFNQTGTTQAPNLFQASKPSTGFGIFGQTNTTPAFGQTTQPTFGTNFGKLTQPTFTQPTQPAFGTNLTGGLQQQSLFGNTATKPASLFGTTTTGGNLFNSNIFQQTPNAFSLNMNQQQNTQFPPESSDDKNFSAVATDIFPDGQHVLALEPAAAGSSNTTNPRDLKYLLDNSKKREELAESRTKVKVHLPRPKRGNNYNKDFFETSQGLRRSHKCLVIRKFNEVNSSSTIFNKYKNEILQEANDCLQNDSDADSSSFISPRSNSSELGELMIGKMPEYDQSETLSEYRRRVDRLNLALEYSDDPIPPAQPEVESILDEIKNYKGKPLLKESSEPTSANKTSLEPTILKNSPPESTSPKNSPPESTSPKPSTSQSTSVQVLSDDEDESVSSIDLEATVALEVKNVDNPAGVILTKPEYYMYPALKDLGQYMNDKGECIVQGLTIGRRGYGNIYFPDAINIANMNFDELVHFRHREVTVYPSDKNKPPVGEGLNRPAQVTLDKIYPREQGTNNYVTDVNEIIQANFVENLMHVTLKHNSRFVDYRPKTGSWVFKVQHFSKYAYTESGEEECEIDGKIKTHKKIVTKPQGWPKKLGDTDEIQFGLSASLFSHSDTVKDSDRFFVEPLISEGYTSDDHETLTDDLYRTISAVQSLKFEESKQEIRSGIVVSPKTPKLPDVSCL